MANDLDTTKWVGHVAPKDMPFDHGTPDNWHRHICPNCSCVWAHNGQVAEKLSAEEHEKAHTCPNCLIPHWDSYYCLYPGTDEYWKVKTNSKSNKEIEI